MDPEPFRVTLRSENGFWMMPVMLLRGEEERLARALSLLQREGRLLEWSIDREPPPIDLYEFFSWLESQGMEGEPQRDPDWPYDFERPET